MSTRRILIIEDDKELAEGMADILMDEGFIVEVSGEYNAKLAASVFDAAILDYKLKNMTGVDVLKAIKHKNPETRIFMISGRPFIEQILEQEKVSGLIEGVFKKPFDINALIEKIKKS
ncbi:MAG: response regulator [Candidatus Omnitrophota bacterium]